MNRRGVQSELTLFSFFLYIASMRLVTRKPPKMFIDAIASASKPKCVRQPSEPRRNHRHADGQQRADDNHRRNGVGHRHQRRVQCRRHATTPRRSRRRWPARTRRVRTKTGRWRRRCRRRGRVWHDSHRRQQQVLRRNGACGCVATTSRAPPSPSPGGEGLQAPASVGPSPLGARAGEVSVRSVPNIDANSRGSASPKLSVAGRGGRFRRRGSPGCP